MNPRLQDHSEIAKPAGRRRPETLPAGAPPQSPSASSENRQQTLQRLRDVPPVLQRVDGEIRASAPVIQRMTVLANDLVSFTKDEPKPNFIGKLAGDDVYVYRSTNLHKTDPQYKDVVVYKRESKAAIALSKKLAEARKSQSVLFDEAHGGAVEGTFEYVANYLYAEVPQTQKQRIWDQVWDVRPVGNDAQRFVKDQLKWRRRKFLEELIVLGLDASWKPTSVIDIAKAPGKKSMKVVTGEAKRIPGQLQPVAPKPVGIGFHTTDGPPDKVVGTKAEGGWGGILQTLTVPFFRARYALDAGWNPLGRFLAEKGPTFRKEIQDNELLSTVSVATDSHATLRFPLWTPTRTGDKDAVNAVGERSFKMEAWLYVVAVRGEAYATYAHQDNPFGEIAVANVLPSDVIGWCKLTRWHDYEGPDQPSPDGKLIPQVATADFYYELSALNRNPKFATDAFHDKVFAAANASIEAERVESKDKYVSSK